MEREGPEQRLYATSAAAKQLGLAKSSLNRLAPIYERVYGELPRSKRNVRLWSLEAMDRLQSARLAVQEGRVANIEAALWGSAEITERAQASPEPARNAEETLETQPLPPRLLEVLVEELHALRKAVEDQNEVLRGQAYRLGRFQGSSPPPLDSTPETPKEASLEAPDRPQSSAEDRKEGKDARQVSTDRRVFGAILPIILVMISIAVTVISALYKDALVSTASLVVVASCLLFGWHYYAKAAGRQTEDRLAKTGAQADEQIGNRESG